MTEIDKIKQKLDSMSIQEFDDMLDKCGIMTIKPSNKSDYVECLNTAVINEQEIIQIRQKNKRMM